MKLNNLFIGLVTLTTLLSACKTESELTPIEDKIFIAETGLQANYRKKVLVADEDVFVPVTAQVSNPQDRDIQVKIELNEAALKAYNELKGTDYTILPASQVKIAKNTITIPKGKVLSEVTTLAIQPLTEEMSLSGKKYALPITISTDDNIESAKGLETIIYEIDEVIITSVPILNSWNNFKLEFPKNLELGKEWTVEFRVNIDLLGTRIGELNNQTIFGAWGDGSEIYSRFGDAPIKGNIFQVKTMGTQVNSTMEFQPNTWYHIAIVTNEREVVMYANGQEIGKIASPGKATVLDRGQFGNQDYLRANVMISEFRIWNKAIPQSNLMDNAFKINPKSDGLMVYLKFNEGEGNTFKDYTGNGYNATASGSTVWKHGIRSDQK